MSRYTPGQMVLVRPLKKRAEIIAAAGSKAYRVRLGTVTLRVNTADLEPDTSGTSASSRAPEVRVNLPARSGKAKTSIDLHGLRVHEAVLQLEEAINEAVLHDIDRLDVVHGLGSGKVLMAVTEVLSRLTVVARFERDSFNSGITRVYFR